ncbi:MAG: family 43 glycosylhydrolase [Clostridia bacterium]|nr:family 43 glycosylhydrolase [Clostridia bacterium]
MKKQVFNPYLPLHECIPDGEPHVFGDRVYIYGSHETEGGDCFCNLDYVTYSAPVTDLESWRYEGVIYEAKNDPLYPKFRYMFAPDVVRGNDGRYYLYYSLSNHYPDCSYVMSVAVSDSPAGPFAFHGYVQNPDGTPLTDYAIFDPGLINDDGVIRLYYGMRFDFEENPNLTEEEVIAAEMRTFRKTREEVLNTPGGVMGAVTVELEDDMLTVKHKPYHILPRKVVGTPFEAHPFFEGSSMRKIGDKYYFIYSTIKNHELAYATSDYPDRDFAFGGVIVSNGDIGYKGRRPEDRLARTGNTHGSIELINGKWYVFYHRQTHKNEFSRQACAEPVEILSDGSIPQVEMTSCGLNGGPLVTEGVYPAVLCCNLTNGRLPHGTCVHQQVPHIVFRDGDRFVTEVDDGTTLGFKYFAFRGMQKLSVTYRVTEHDPAARICIHVGGETLAEILLENAGGWHTETVEVPFPVGTFPLYLTYKGQGLIEIKEINF